MKPFGFFFVVAVLVLVLTLSSICTPANWAIGYKPGDWFTVLYYVLASISALAGVYMVRIYREAAWIRVAMTLAFSVIAFLTLIHLTQTIAPDMMEGDFIRISISTAYLFVLLVSIFVVISMLCVKAKDIRTPFRWLGTLGILEIFAGFLLELFTIEHWPHPGIVNTTYLLAIPGRLIAIWLNYRFWQGELGRTAGWEKEVESIGEEV